MTIDYIISKRNEVYAKIQCEKGMAYELSSYFTFMVPGFKFNPLYKNKVWDGKIRLFNLKTFQIYLGLLPYIEEFCREREYTFEYDHTRPDIEDEFSAYHATKFIDSLNIHSGGKKIEPYDNQFDAFVHSMQKRRALIISPTASGKSYIAYLLFRQLLDYQKLKGLIIVPTTSLVEQLYTDFIDYSSHNGFDVESNVHRIYEGHEKNSDKKLYISTWQSLYKMPEEYFNQFQYIIGDEAHQFKANSLVSIMTKCMNTKYRIGMTGSLDGTKTHKLVLEGLFGTQKRVATTKDLIDKGQLSQFEIKCLVLKHDDAICEQISKLKTYEDELKFLIGCENRNKFIRNLAISLGTNTLILYQFVEKHGQILYDMIRNTEKLGNRKIFFIHGGVDTEDREVIRGIMEKEQDAIVVASFGTFSTGVNIRNLHNLIMASPVKSRIRNLQSIGRSLRLSISKKATLYDIADDLVFKKRMNHTLRHFVERVGIYNEEKFPYKIYKIGLKNGQTENSNTIN